MSAWYPSSVYQVTPDAYETVATRVACILNRITDPAAQAARAAELLGKNHRDHVRPMTEAEQIAQLRMRISYLEMVAEVDRRYRELDRLAGIEIVRPDPGLPERSRRRDRRRS